MTTELVMILVEVVLANKIYWMEILQKLHLKVDHYDKFYFCRYNSPHKHFE